MFSESFASLHGVEGVQTKVFRKYRISHSGYSARLLELHSSRSDLGVYFLPLSPLCFLFFSKMPRLELTFSESKFAACQSGTLSRVSRAFRIPDIDSRAKCVRSIKLSLIPNPNTVTSLLLVRMSPNTVCVRACALVLAVVTCPCVITAYSREHE